MWDDRGRGQHPKLSAHLRPTLCLQGNAHDYEVITITAKPSKPVPHLRQFPNNQNLQQGIITVCRTLGKSCQPSLPNQVIFPKITWRSLLQVTGSSYLENCSKDAMTWHIWLPQFARQPLQYGDKYKSLKHIFKASSTHTIHVHRYMHHITNFSRFARLNGC